MRFLEPEITCCCGPAIICFSPLLFPYLATFVCSLALDISFPLPFPFSYGLQLPPLAALTQARQAQMIAMASAALGCYDH